LRVLENDQPGFNGHEFKMNIYKNSPEAPEFNNDFEVMIMSFMNVYDIQDYRSNGINDPQQDKLRITFKIREKEQALRCYKDFCLHNKKILNDSVSNALFLQKPEHIFVKFADEVAATMTEQQLEEVNKKRPPFERKERREPA